MTSLDGSPVNTGKDQANGSAPKSRHHAEGVPLRAMNGGRRTSTRSQSAQPQTPRHGKASRGWTAFYIIAGAVFVVLGGTYVVYTSAHPSAPVYTISESDGQDAVVAVSARDPLPTNVPAPLREVVPEPIQANAIVNVPSVGLRNAPDITARSLSGTLKRGEAVEIVKRHASWGPEWVKIRTKSGKAGWVFASVVKERK